MKLNKITYITLWTKRFDEMIKFYKDKLELPIEYQDENFAQFATEGAKLYLHRIMHKEGDLRRNTVEVHFSVDDVDEIYSQLKTKGVDFGQEPKNMPWGRTVAFRDPEGYVIELVGEQKPDEPIEPHP